MKNKFYLKSEAFYLALALFLVTFILVSGITTAFGGYGAATEGEWYNVSWHYRIKMEINSTGVNRTNWPVEQALNFTDLLPSGTFDLNSLRLFEYNSSGKLKYVQPLQFDLDDYYNNATNALGELVFLMNGTTPANTTRIFYLYYDTVENGAKASLTYATNLSYGQSGQYLEVNNTYLQFKLDTNRGENTSGIYEVNVRSTEVPVVIESSGGRTAEYTEYFNGTDNTTFDLRNNLSFVPGPVRLTLRQEGPEIQFGNVSNPTGVGRIIKKYYFYTTAGAENFGSFLKISQEVIFNATTTRSSNSGALALDVNRTFLSANMPSYGNSTAAPSWAWAIDSGGSVAGIVVTNQTNDNYFASVNPPEPTDIGRIGVSLANSSVSGSLKQITLVYFGRGGTDGSSEFLGIKDGISNALGLAQNLTEKWTVVTTPSLSPLIYNRNETLLIYGNLTTGDPYTIVSYMNATLDLGTGTNLTFALYDDATHGDLTGGDKLFTGNYTFLANATLGSWSLNLTAYGNATEYLNSSVYLFNVTNIYNLNTTILNPVGLIGRTVLTNLTLRNFLNSSTVKDALVSCVFNNTAVVNITDNGDGTYSINFTAPPAVDVYQLFCNATKASNFGNQTVTFLTEPTKTFMALNLTPFNVSLANITLLSNSSFVLAVNASNIGNGTARNVTLTFDLLTGWSLQPALQGCGDVGVNSSCTKNFSIVVPQNTSPGIYVINASALWTDPDGTTNLTKQLFNVTVLSNSKLSIIETNLTGTGADGLSRNITTFTLASVGNDNATNINFTCASGVVCQNFTVLFYPNNLSSLAVGANETVSVFVTVPFAYAPGIYTGVVAASATMDLQTVTLYVTIQNTTNITIATSPTNTTIGNMSIYSGANFFLETNLTNIGNSSALSSNLSFVLPPGWSVNSSFENCGNLTSGAFCAITTQVSVPNNTAASNYTINLTAGWQNLGGSAGAITQGFNVSILANPVVDVLNATLTGTVNEGSTANAFNLTVLSVGSSNITGVSFTCASGDICNNFGLVYTPNTITTLAVGNTSLVHISVTVPSMFQAGTYNGTLLVNTTNDGVKTVMMFVTVPSNRLWTMTPTTCQKSTFLPEGKVCDINVTNTGNDVINFTVQGLFVNNTVSNETNFTVPTGNSHLFSVLYNVTGFVQSSYNSTYLVAAVQQATPANLTFNITLLPYAPPLLSLDLGSAQIEQTGQIVILANVTDATNSGIMFTNVSITRPDGTTDNTSMTLLSQNGNLSQWQLVYGNSSFGNTTDRGIYNVTVFSSDNIGNLANATANFSVRIKLSLAASTLSTNYYQGDTGTIYYSARDPQNNGVPNITTNFFVYNQNATLIYTTSKVTDAYGTFAPLPVFSLASDAPVGNYSLVTNSYYNDTVLGIPFTVQNNYSFSVTAKTVTVTGLFADIETAVVWFPSNVMRFNMLVYDGEGRTNDPDAMALRVYDPAQNVYFSTNLSSMTRNGQGFYSYSLAMPANSATGMYLAVLNLSKGSLSTMKLAAFRVSQGGPYDVRLFMPKSEISQGNPMDFLVTVENKGEVTQDVFINYTIASATTGKVYYQSSEAVLTPAFTNQSFTRTAFVFSGQPLGTYILTATVKYDNTQPAINATVTFAVVANTAQPPAAGGGGGGGGGGLGTNPPEQTIIETPEAPRAIIIEKYSNNITMYPGFTRLDYVVVRNSGTALLKNISLTLLGISSDWFNVTPGSYGELYTGNATAFVIEYHLPDNAVVGDYKANLIATTSVTSDQKGVTITVLRSIQDVILSEINILKKDLKALLINVGEAKNQGKNVNDVLTITDSIDEKIKSAETNLDLNNTQTAMNNVKDAKVLIEKAKDLLSKLETVQPEQKIDLVLIIALAGTFGGMSSVFFVLRRRKALPKHIPPTLAHLFGLMEKIKGKGVDEEGLRREKDKVTRMLAMLDKEKKEGIVSDDAYKEMKNSVESKLSRLEKKLKKVKP